MHRMHLAGLAAIFLTAPAIAQEKKQIALRWYGHSFFVSIIYSYTFTGWFLIFCKCAN